MAISTRTWKLFQMMHTFNINCVDLHKSFLPFIPRIPRFRSQIHIQHWALKPFQWLSLPYFECLRSWLALSMVQMTNKNFKWERTPTHTPIQSIPNKKWAFWIFGNDSMCQQEPIPDPGSWSTMIYGNIMALNIKKSKDFIQIPWRTKSHGPWGCFCLDFLNLNPVKHIKFPDIMSLSTLYFYLIK